MGQMTFTIGASSDDGTAFGIGATYPPSTIFFEDEVDWSSFAERSLIAGDYQTHNAFLRFDTSALPDTAAITSAYLRLYVNAIANDGKYFYAEYYDHGASITNADWTNTEANDAHSGTALGSISLNAWNDFYLSSLTSINKTGYTGFRCHISGPAPTGANSIGFAAYDSTVNIPELVVNYLLNIPSRNLLGVGW